MESAVRISESTPCCSCRWSASSTATADLPDAVGPMMIGNGPSWRFGAIGNRVRSDAVAARSDQERRWRIPVLGPLLVISYVCLVLAAAVMCLVRPNKGMIWAALGLAGAVLMGGLVVAYIAAVDPPTGATRSAMTLYLAAG